VKVLQLSINDIFNLQINLSTLGGKCARNAAGDTSAYRIAKNQSILVPLIEGSREHFAKRLAERAAAMKDGNGTEPTEEDLKPIREELSVALVNEKEEVRLRVLPWNGLRWSEMTTDEKNILFFFGLVEGDEPLPEPVPEPIPTGSVAASPLSVVPTPPQ